MNLLKAREILELGVDFDETTLKKNYRSLAKKYHPDKNKEHDANQKFGEIDEAYKYLLKYQPEAKVDTLLSDMFKTFMSFNVPSKPKTKKNIITLTPREYFEGTVKIVNTFTKCSCESNLCIKCAGCGFSINNAQQFKPFDVCMNCVGEGYIQNCNLCNHGIIIKPVNVVITPKCKNEFFHNVVGLIKIKVNSYFFKDDQIYYRFNISLKESLIGFHKKFKDPFDVEHDIVVNKIIKTNDGYHLKKINLILVFNVIYPDTLDKSIIEKLNTLIF